MKKRAFISILLTLAGCAPQVVWTKPNGFTQQDFAQDSYACEKDMRQSAYFGGGIAGGSGGRRMPPAGISRHAH